MDVYCGRTASWQLRYVHYCEVRLNPILQRTESPRRFHEMHRTLPTHCHISTNTDDESDDLAGLGLMTFS